MPKHTSGVPFSRPGFRKANVVTSRLDAGSDLQHQGTRGRTGYRKGLSRGKASHEYGHKPGSHGRKKT